MSAPREEGFGEFDSVPSLLMEVHKPLYFFSDASNSTQNIVTFKKIEKIGLFGSLRQKQRRLWTCSVFVSSPGLCRQLGASVLSFSNADKSAFCMVSFTRSAQPFQICLRQMGLESLADWTNTAEAQQRSTFLLPVFLFVCVQVYSLFSLSLSSTFLFLF